MMDQTQTQDQQPTSTSSPLDDIIGRVKSYVKNPNQVTPDTLNQLLSELEDLKSYMDEEEAPSGEQGDNQSPMDHKRPGIAVMIGLGKGKGA